MQSENILSNKCTNCGSELLYNATTRCISCVHCDTSEKIPHSPAPPKKVYSTKIEKPCENYRTLQFRCGNCGNIHAIVSEKGLKRCPSCGSVDLVKMFDISMKPHSIVPFVIDREQAGRIFENWLKSRRLIPNNLVKLAENRKVSAAYHPVWSYDYKNVIEYKGFGVKEDSEGNSRRYPISGNETVIRKNYIISANSTFSGKIFRDLGGFELSNAHSFDPRFAFGWSAQKNDVDIHESFNRMKNLAHDDDSKLIADSIKKKGNFDYLSRFETVSSFTNVAYHYSFLPLWVNHFSYRERDYHCFINGHSGRVSGKVPRSIAKIFILALGIAAAIAAIATFVAINF